MCCLAIKIHLNWLHDVSLTALSSGVLVTADSAMADMTSSPDYGSALLVPACGPADADSLDQITLR